MWKLEEQNIVSVWLRFLNIEEYSERFIDNGYDDLETVKMIGEDDLKAMGIDNKKDKEMILLSVKILREHGGAWVYLLLGEEEGAASSSGKKSLSDDEGSSLSRPCMSPSSQTHHKEDPHFRMNYMERTSKLRIQNLCWQKICL